MSLTKEQLNEIKNIKSLDELKQKAEENHIKANDALLEDLFNSYHSESELSEDELDNVTGGCGDTVVSSDGYCKNYEHYLGVSNPIMNYKRCFYCKYCYYEIEDGNQTFYCSY